MNAKLILKMVLGAAGAILTIAAGAVKEDKADEPKEIKEDK